MSGNWTPEQVKLAFHLYCQLPFGRLHHSNPEIIALAELIGRTPSAVAMKLTNLASLDPAIIASGRKGLSGASNLDRAIWDEFHADWEGLVIECTHIRSKLEGSHDSMPEIEPLPISTPDDFTGETRTQTVQQRIKQSFFRRAVLASYGNRCCITGLSEPRLLIASHIVPWSQDKANRLNPSNGLCLSALYDRAFDQGLMTFDEDWRVVLSSQLQRQPQSIFEQWFKAIEGQPIQLPERFMPDASLMRKHRETLFLDNH
ncbi:HNH endonuclease [Marinobacterium sediminicola]|uniref:Restriction endonuclease n=1 Tax=Marinobacterium sediminicola TaxID=518898 RepID=A0ABY1S231_9GAMM|nr:HNH endonuclease [Marinobacterium sediminicola]ULG69401.1 HNH endonuclease [Marinobacterium sediminicola]SMR75549.1 putative restriction endonuclease [Marinobacterium sediminicola]